MKNKCYNCVKALDPDRTCMSDGGCDWFEPVLKEDGHLDEKITIDQAVDLLARRHFWKRADT